MTSLQAQYHELRETIAETIAQKLTDAAATETEKHLDDFCAVLEAVETDISPVFTTKEVRDALTSLDETIKTNPLDNVKRSIANKLILVSNFAHESAKYYLPKLKNATIQTKDAIVKVTKDYVIPYGKDKFIKTDKELDKTIESLGENVRLGAFVLTVGAAKAASEAAGQDLSIDDILKTSEVFLKHEREKKKP